MWEPGRQNSGYFKKKIFESKLLKFDCYLLKYPKGSIIYAHKDPAPDGFKHHRLNIVLRNTNLGGYFYQGDKGFQPKSKRLFYFRPDIEKHGLTKIEGSTRYVLSIGWLR